MLIHWPWLIFFRLIITELDLKDSGVYSAKVGDLETKAELKVQGKRVLIRSH